MAVRAPIFQRRFKRLAVNTIKIIPPYQCVKPSGFYVYLHKCLDTGREFYVGKGKAKRAWDRSASEWRSKHWMRTAAKHGVSVEILQDGMTEEDALLLEMWVIAKIRSAGGRLVNMTDGGDGTSGRVVSDALRARMSNLQGRKVNCSNGMTFNSYNDAAKWLSDHLGKTIKGPALGCAVRGKSHIAYGLAWWRGGDTPKNLTDQIEKVRYSKGKAISTSCGMRFLAIRDAVNFLRNNGFPSADASNIWMCAIGKCKTAYGYVWSYDGSDRDKLAAAHASKRKPHSKSIAIESMDGRVFSSANAAAIDAISRGYPSANRWAVLKAARTGSELFGTMWKLHKREN